MFFMLLAPVIRTNDFGIARFDTCFNKHTYTPFVAVVVIILLYRRVFANSILQQDLVIDYRSFTVFWQVRHG